MEFIRGQKDNMADDYARLRRKFNRLAANSARAFWHFVPRAAPALFPNVTVALNPRVVTSTDLGALPPLLFVTPDVLIGTGDGGDTDACNGSGGVGVDDDDDDSSSDGEHFLDDSRDWLEVGRTLQHCIIGGDLSGSRGSHGSSWDISTRRGCGGDEYELLECIGHTRNALLFRCRLLHRQWDASNGSSISNSSSSSSSSSGGGGGGAGVASSSTTDTSSSATTTSSSDSQSESPSATFRSRSGSGSGSSIGGGGGRPPRPLSGVPVPLASALRGSMSGGGGGGGGVVGLHRRKRSNSSVGNLEHLGGEDTLVMKVCVIRVCVSV
jgi:hypothetical protein